ncbi:ABC type transporter, ATP binding component [sediment metagenome]|uniref:ABC type transporter, ATP binding component n=1 Tax=sediment metagenome TaxID=749907 RepID=D9PKH0_9ZZZZ
MGLDTIIEFEKARIFQKDNLILSDVNLSINKGEFVYFIGKVGTGKSSLIKTINAEIPLKEGEGKVVGFDLKKIRTKQVPFLRRKLGIVFQDFQLLSDRSVHDNLHFVLKATGWTGKQEINDRIAQVLEKVNLGYKGYKMPHQLSGGEQQRVVIARALLNDPEIILADEPTGNLDPETSVNLMKILLEISSSGRAVIMATHDYNMVKQFPARTIKFDNGKVFEQGLSDEIDFASLKEY